MPRALVAAGLGHRPRGGALADGAVREARRGGFDRTALPFELVKTRDPRMHLGLQQMAFNAQSVCIRPDKSFEERAMTMGWTRDAARNALLSLGADEIQKAVVHHVSMLDAGQCTADECIVRILTAQTAAMRFIIGPRRAALMRQWIEEALETGGTGD